jgi:hypothetical protein
MMVMPHVAIEAVIMAPLLILEILIFPIVASTMTSQWTDNSRQVALQETANQLAGVIQQLYLSLNTGDVLAGTVTVASTLPKEVTSYPYTATGSLQTSLGSNSGKILILQVKFQGVGNTATASAAFGSNVEWNQASVFYSASPSAAIQVQKFANITGTFLRFSFM